MGGEMAYPHLLVPQPLSRNGHPQELQEKKELKFAVSLEHVYSLTGLSEEARGDLTLLSPWASVSLWVSSFTSSASCLARSLASLNS